MTRPPRYPIGFLVLAMTLWAASPQASPPPPPSPIKSIPMAHGHLQQQEIGAARWVLEKATRQAPRSIILQQCLNRVTQAVPSPPPQHPRLTRALTLVTRLTLIEWGTLTSMGVSMMSLLWVVCRWRRRLPSMGATGWVVIWMGVCAMGLGTYAWEWRYPWAIQGQAHALALTPNGSTGDITVVAGEKVRQVGRQGEWVHIERSNGQRGWVPAATCWRL